MHLYFFQLVWNNESKKLETTEVAPICACAIGALKILEKAMKNAILVRLQKLPFDNLEL